jgi:hypothetical protein
MRRDLPTWVDHLLIGAVAVGGALYYSLVASRVTGPGFPLDDSWIHMQFARNLATGNGFSYNPGTLSSGSTAPLWTFVVALSACLRIDPVTGAKVIGTALTVVTAIAAAQIVRLLTASRFGAMVGGLAVAMSARLTWASVSGMEVSLYCALTTLAVLAYLRALRNGGGILWALLAGLAGAARPEAFLVFPILLAHRAWDARHRPGAGGWRHLLGPCAAFGLIVGAYVVFNLVVGGQPLPNTFYAKNGARGLLHAIMERDAAALRASLLTDPMDSLNALFRWAQDQSLFLTLGVLAGLLAATGVLAWPGADLRGGIVLVAIFLIAPIMKGLLVPMPGVSTQEGRYVMHVLVLYFILAAIGLAYLRVQARKHWLVTAFAVLALTRLVSQDVKFAPHYAAQVKNINDLQVVTAAWIRQHTAPDAIIATNDIGAIAYFGRRQIIDTEGLVTPAVIPYNRRKNLVPYLEQTRPDLVIIFPEWYPTLAARTDLLQEIGRVTVRPAVVAGGENLVIYRTPWTRPGRVTGVEGAGVEAQRRPGL